MRASQQPLCALLAALQVFPCAGGSGGGAGGSGGGAGCTVPTAFNYNSSASADDGSCSCQSRAHPDGFHCSPDVIRLATEFDEGAPGVAYELLPLCRERSRPLACVHCSPTAAGRGTCKYSCEAADGAQCTRLDLEADLFKMSEVVSKEVNVMTSGVMVLLVLVSVLLERCPPWLPLQESMAWIIVGMLLAAALHLFAMLEGEQPAEAVFEQHIEFKGWVFFYLLLPPIILDAGYSMKSARFFRNFDRILMFSVFGTTISAVVIAAVLWSVDLGVIEHNHPYEALRFGALISATDPVASLSVLASLRGPLTDPDVSSVISGEAILNDATAIVLFTVFEHPGATVHQDAGVGLIDLQRMVLRFCTVAIGSVGLGILAGLGCAVLTRTYLIPSSGQHGQAQPHEEFALVQMSAYGAYVLADYADLSGIIALFFCAVCLSHWTKPILSVEAQRVTVLGFKSVAYLAEACTFTYIGVDFVIGLNWSSVQPRFVSLTVVACMLGRLCNIVPGSFVLNSCRGSSAGGTKKKNGDKLEARSQILLLVAGLRGPVAYGLAKTWRAESDDVHFAHIVSTTLIVCVLTTFVFGGAFATVVRWLGMEQLPDENDGRATPERSEGSGSEDEVRIAI